MIPGHSLGLISAGVQLVLSAGRRESGMLSRSIQQARGDDRRSAPGAHVGKRDARGRSPRPPDSLTAPAVAKPGQLQASRDPDMHVTSSHGDIDRTNTRIVMPSIFPGSSLSKQTLGLNTVFSQK